MKIETLCIPLTDDLQIPIFNPCSDKVALNVTNILNNKNDNDKLIAEAKAIIMSSTGLSLAIANILQNTYGSTVHVENVECMPLVKQHIVEKSNNLLSECEHAFSRHSPSFDQAIFAYAKEIDRTVRSLYNRNICKPEDTVVVILESFLFVTYEKLQTSEKTDFNDDDSENENHVDEDTYFL